MRHIKRKLFILLVATCIIATAIPTFSFAAEKEPMQEIQNIVDLFEDFSLGDTLRTVKDVTGYKDVYHVISPSGEGVLLTIDPLGAKIKSILCKSDENYTLKYQWYKCNAFKKKAQKMEGADQKTMTTKQFDKVGLQYYYCKINVYKKSALKNTYVRSFKTPMYVVGYTGLPVVMISTADGKDIMSRKEWKKDSSIQIVNGIDDNSQLEGTKTIKIKGRGNSTWNGSTKAGYTIKFDDKQNLFEIGKDKKWALVGNFSDRSLLRNWMATSFDKEFFNTNTEAEWNVTHKHVELIINGEYRGNFTLASTVKLGNKRIDVPDISEKVEKDLNKDGKLDYYDTGFVLEIDNREDSSHHFRTEIANVPVSLSDPDLDDPADTNDAIVAHVKAIVQNAENAIYSDDFAGEDGYKKYIDVDSFVDWYLLEELAKNQDGRFNLSTYMYYQPKDGKLHMAAAWDFDIAFGNGAEKEFQKSDGIGCQEGWYTRLLQDPAFRNMVNEKWRSVSSDISEFVKKDVAEQSRDIKVSARMNFIKWPELGMYIWPAANGWWTRWTYSSEVKYLQDWTLARIDWLNNNGF